MHPGQKAIIDAVQGAINRQEEMEQKAAMYDNLELLEILNGIQRIQEIAFSIPAPNPYTPQIAQVIIEMSLKLRKMAWESK